MSKFKNIYNKTRTNEDWDNYKRQRSFFVNLLCTLKKDYVQKLNKKSLIDLIKKI